VDGEVKIRGFRIDLGEVEAVLREHEDVAQAAVVVREDASGLASLGAYVALKMGRQFVPSELRQFLSRMLPEHFIPSSFWRLGALPVSPNGKIDRKALPILDSSTRGEGGFVAPRSDLEERIARIWAGVLSLDRVGAQDNFFDLGGHSLLATQVISRLRQQFDVNLPLRIMFEPSLTVVELARAVVIDEVERAGIDETAHLIRDIEQLTEGELASELDADG
jgi:acyl carrier protein